MTGIRRDSKIEGTPAVMFKVSQTLTVAVDVDPTQITKVLALAYGVNSADVTVTRKVADDGGMLPSWRSTPVTPRLRS